MFNSSWVRFNEEGIKSILVTIIWFQPSYKSASVHVTTICQRRWLYFNLRSRQDKMKLNSCRRVPHSSLLEHKSELDTNDLLKSKSVSHILQWLKIWPFVSQRLQNDSQQPNKVSPGAETEKWMHLQPTSHLPSFIWFKKSILKCILHSRIIMALLGKQS